MKSPFIATATLVAACVALPVAASAQTPPTPPPLNLNLGNYSVSASTNQANGSVNYQVDSTQLASQGGTASTSSHRSGSGGRSCVGTTPDQAGVQFVGTGMTIAPLYQGQQLPFVGGVPASTSGDPADSTTLSNAVEYIVVCNGVPTGFGLYVPGSSARPITVPGTPTTVAGFAQSVAGSIVMPKVTIATSPVVKGLVRLPTWFWATGYSGRPIIQTRNALGASIEVDATPVSYTWSFGDDSPPLDSPSLGVPYPQTTGSVVHNYTATSPGFPVSVTFNLAVSYRVDGGPAIPLPAIQRTAALSYPVYEINTIIVAR
jgi:hypothetical protein